MNKLLTRQQYSNIYHNYTNGNINDCAKQVQRLTKLQLIGFMEYCNYNDKGSNVFTMMQKLLETKVK